MEPHQQDASGPMSYPARGTLNRILFKTPIVGWRLGLRPLLWRRMILLTTWGRKSRLPRHTMLSYTIHGAKPYLISGWGTRTDWYRNLQADPRATAQLAGKPFHVRARRVGSVDEFAAVMQIMLRTGGDSHFRPWLKSLGIAYELDDLTAKRERVHLIALDASAEAGPPGMKADLAWLLPALLLALAIGAFVIARPG
jgi:deazaflavin-dependent oxidoreductase (nitroreductase family)